MSGFEPRQWPRCFSGGIWYTREVSSLRRRTDPGVDTGDRHEGLDLWVRIPPEESSLHRWRNGKRGRLKIGSLIRMRVRFPSGALLRRPVLVLGSGSNPDCCGFESHPTHRVALSVMLVKVRNFMKHGHDFALEAHVGERALGMREVVGSNPIVGTCLGLWCQLADHPTFNRRPCGFESHQTHDVPVRGIARLM